MSFDFLSNTELQKAKTEYMHFLRNCGFAPKCESIPVTDANGRVTSRAVYARICAPHYHACAMDGVALRAEQSFGASEAAPAEIKAGEYTPVDTGDPLPEGCDCVIMIEDVVENPDGGIRLYAPAAPWQHIRQIGEDICAGEMILPSDTRITPAALGALLAGGVHTVEVYKKPTVGIIPTGDEIVPADKDPAAGEILEFNSAVFSAMAADWGCRARTYPIVPDNSDLIKQTLKKAVTECDIVLINAGSSAGREDYTAAAVAEIGEVFIHGVAIKPGKPAILAAAGSVPIIGVPGYPVSGIIVIEQFLKPLAALAAHTEMPAEETVEATLTRPVISGFKYREFIRLRMGYVNNRLTAAPLGRGAGVVSSFMKADGILEIPQGVEGCEAGASVPVRLLRSEEELRSALVVIGSHDPLLDELCDLLRPEGIYMSSSHVGSLGGLLAIKRGEAHAAGVHLLDEAGGYNTAYIKKYFPEGGLRLLECVGRTQGLIVQKGNPKSIGGIADLARDNLRYVNRQKGSGTRILLDYLCKKDGIDPEKIYGYNREELTHTSVAAQIAADSADAGLGIYSAAKIYGLDFIPVCTEQYDIAVPDCAWDTPVMKKLIEALQSEQFRQRLNRLGGYTWSAPGSVRERF